MTFSEEQIIALAPDAASVKAGKDLAKASKWGLLCASDKTLWGECQGSGKLPYQAQVDLLNVAFKCSCPSRKFPCKHGLGLLLQFTRDPSGFTKTTEPDWVIQWLEKRVEKAEKKAEQKDKPVDVEAQAKRGEARAKKVSNGVEDLQIWLKDLVRNGLLDIPSRAYEFWQNPAKRMVDAQAPGLAGMVRGLGTINFYGADWQYDLLNKLSRIYLASEAYKNIDALPDDWKNEIKTLVGFQQGKEEVLSQDGVNDNWLVLARTFSDEEQLTVERNWLYGVNSKRWALILQFYANGQLPELNLMPGTAIKADLVFYKGVNPIRALIKTQHSVSGFTEPTLLEDFKTAFEHFGEALATNPFTDKIPVLIKDVQFKKLGDKGYFTDKDGGTVLSNSTLQTDLKLLALTGGKPGHLFLMGSETEFEPLGVWIDDKYLAL
ncbi:MAG: zinc finger family protein [Bacteroidota bacterium]|nr:zinc finger family protein [Bacteroidota bacterium]